ncbi:MAG: sigma-70 family RNA polymerase sigma factor [Solirubrobacteraceae bacterium]
MHRTDNALLERARRGDVAAFEELVERHQTAAFRTAFVLCRDAAEAEEAAQDGFVKAFAALGRFRSGAPLRPWLLTIVANEARNRARAAGRRRLAERTGAEGPATPSPEALALTGERDADLRAALARLDDRDRQVLWLRFFSDLSEAETAAALGCRRGTVKSRTSRALARLRKELSA